MNDELPDPSGRGGRSVRTGTERAGRGRPGEFDQLGRFVGNLYQTVGEALLEPKLPQQPNHRPEAIAELLEHEPHRVGAFAKHDEGGRLLDCDQAEVAEACPNRPPGPDLERQAG